MVVLLDQLGADGYAGLDTSGLDALSARERQLVLDVARRGLTARQILTKDEDGAWQVGQFALAALGISLSPTQSVMVFRGKSQDTAVSYLFHSAQDVFITHEVTENDTHQFFILRDGQTWQESILSAVGLGENGNHNSPQVPPLLIRPSLLNEAYEQAQSGSQSNVETILTQAGIDETTAQSLAATLSEPIALTTIIAITHTPESLRQDVTLLNGAQGCWRLEIQNGQEADGPLSITPLSVLHARQQVIDLIS